MYIDTSKIHDAVADWDDPFDKISIINAMERFKDQIAYYEKYKWILTVEQQALSLRHNRILYNPEFMPPKFNKCKCDH